MRSLSGTATLLDLMVPYPPRRMKTVEFLGRGRGALINTRFAGIGAVAVFTFVASLPVPMVTNATMTLRVDREEEFDGIDQGEHGLSARPDFQGVPVGSTR